MAKTILLAVFALAALALGALYASERGETQRLAARVADLETQVRHRDADLLKETSAANSLAEEKSKLAAKIDATRKRLLEARSAITSGAPSPGSPDAAAMEPSPAESAPADPSAKKPGGPMGDYLAKMMKDPAMKKMVRSTQSMVQKQMYGDLVKQWGLAPDQASNFYDLLLDHQMAALDAVGQDPSTVSAKVKDSDAQLKASLGDEMYGQYKDYEKSVPDRMALGQYKQRLDSDGVQALTPDQSKFLIDSMAQARASQTTSDLFANGAASRLAQTGALSEDDMTHYLKAQTDSNDKVAAQASSMLTPAQLTSFKQYQSQMLEMQKAGLEMSSKMFGGAKGP